MKLLLLMLLAAGACASDHATLSLTTTHDSAGVQIVESKGQAPAPFVIDTTPALDIGTTSGDSHQEFSGYVYPVRLSDGRIVVMNGGTHELRFFDAQGKWIKSVGRAGDGPGEFRSMAWLSAGAGDTLRTYDWSLLRVYRFTSDGTFHSAMYLGTPGEKIGKRIIGVLADGRVAARTQKSVDFGSAPAGVHRDTASILVFDAGGATSVSIGQFPAQEDWVERAEKRISITNRAFGKEFYAVAHGSDVVVGTGDASEVFVLDGGRGLKRIVRWSAPTKPITPADVEAYIKPAGAKADEFRVEVMKQKPTAKPSLDGLLVSDDGWIWVERYNEPHYDEPATFEVFDPSGAWKGAVTMPPRFTATRIGADFVLGVWRDVDDVQHVRTHNIRRVN